MQEIPFSLSRETILRSQEVASSKNCFKVCLGFNDLPEYLSSKMSVGNPKVNDSSDGFVFCSSFFFFSLYVVCG